MKFQSISESEGLHRRKTTVKQRSSEQHGKFGLVDTQELENSMFKC